MMARILKRVETTTEPALIVTNDVGDDDITNCVLICTYYYSGDEGEEPPKPKEGDGNTFFLCVDEIPDLISALQEFLPKEAE